MPDATITSTASTFGTITGTFAADQSTVTGTITGVVAGTLSGSVGVPGPQGPVGPQGPKGEPGEGVPVGGTAGQFLTKIDGTNYNTDWTTLNLSAYLTKAGNLEGLTNLPTARDNIGLGSTSDPGFNTVTTESDIYVGRGVPGAGIIFGDDTQQVTAYPGLSILNGYATESWVTTGFAPKASPAFTGNPTAPTPTLSDNDTSIATTAFVKGQGYLTSASLSGYATESWVTAGFAPIAAGLPSNGAEGQILVKQSATAYDAEWQDNFATELRMPARNETGSTLTKGTVVYISGGAGNKPLLSKALATSDATSAQTMGIVTADISNNQNGDVTIRGQLKDLDTSAFAVGTQLYLSGTTAGAYTSTKPSAPTHLVYVGIVVRSNSTEGAIEVAVQNGYELDELHDVSLSSEANNDLLAYESSTNLWKNKTFSALGLLTSATAASTYAPIASPTFTGTVTIPAGASITGYLTTTDAASTYQTIAGMSSYLTTSAAASTYYPLSGNPSGFLTSSSLTGYATESWVTTALGSYLTTSAASSTYLSKADNLASVASTSTARSNLGLGSLDTPTFAGVNVPGSGTSVANLGATSLTINQSGYGQFTIQPSQGIVFPDASIQTTAVNGAVLSDYLTKAGNLSGLANTGTARTNLGLGTMATETASDYLTKAGNLSGLADTSTARTNLGLGTLATVNDAPSDGSQYARKNGAWDVVTGGSSYITSVSSPLAVSTGNLTVDLSAKADLASPTFTGTPSLPTGTTAVTQTLGDNSTKIATTAFVIANAGGGGGGGAVDIQVFGSSTTSGTFTWTKPAGAIWVEYLLYGGGGGGGSGGRYATTSGRSGGGGGAGGGANWGKIGAAALNATETVVVGAGGTGGESRTTDTSAGNAGNNGGASTFKYWTSGQAPGGGAGGTVSGTAGAVRWTKILSQSTAFGGGGAGSTAQGGTPTNVLEQFLTATGGAGGSGAAANVTSTRSGSSGGSQSAQTAQPSIISTVAGGTGGNSSTLTPGGNGVDAPAGIYFRGATGGGSGYYITGTAGGNGGNGGFPSGGGGGGGASDNGFNSGAGGTGGNGFVVIVTYIG
jgi:hypothetical protein